MSASQLHDGERGAAGHRAPHRRVCAPADGGLDDAEDERRHGRADERGAEPVDRGRRIVA
ncbi:hypothetical protein [Mycolicibacterium goodii]|uniref:hypothetical protein n=1 Tax=Mycolicibacterium goodii TaxID=134601 RepID=UPI00256EEE88